METKQVIKQENQSEILDIGQNEIETFDGHTVEFHTADVRTRKGQWRVYKISGDVRIIRDEFDAELTPTYSIHMPIHRCGEFASKVKKYWGISDAHSVLEFTEASFGKCPDRPRQMTKDEIAFLLKMQLSEMVELAQTVCSSSEEAIEMVKSCIGVDIKKDYVKPTDNVAIIAHQVDAVVDGYYYGLNALCKAGINGSDVFDEVSNANLRKRFPDGTFHLNEMKKVIKPPRFQEADVDMTIFGQTKEGSW